MNNRESQFSNELYKKPARSRGSSVFSKFFKSRRNTESNETPSTEPAESTPPKLHDVAVDDIWCYGDENRPSEGNEGVKTAESLFDPQTEYYIQMFDPEIIAHTERKRSEFTLDELQNEQPEDRDTKVMLDHLTEKRKKRDAAAEDIEGKSFISRWKAKRAFESADKAFKHARETYINKTSNPPESSMQTNLGKLTVARGKYAEAIFNMRQGGTFNSKPQDVEEFVNASRDYEAARASYLEEIIDRFDITDGQKRHLATIFNQREDGVLAGEEAQHYLTEINDPRNKSMLQKGAEWYNERETWQKTALVGGAAVALGVAGSFAAGGAAAGLLISGRFARGYFRNQAERIKKLGTYHSSEQFERSSVYIGDRIPYRQAYEKQPKASKDERYVTGISNQESVRQRIDKDRQAETRDKQKALGKTVLAVVAGTTLGALVDSYGGRLANQAGAVRDWFDRIDRPDINLPHIDWPNINWPDINIFDDNNGGNGIDSNNGDNNGSTAPNPNDKIEVSPRMEYLYDGFAGQDMSIAIQQDSNVWATIRDQVQRNNPGISFAESDRITGNLLEELKRDNLGKSNWDLVYAGNRFNFDVPAN